MIERQILTALLLRREISLEADLAGFPVHDPNQNSSVRMDAFLELLVEAGTLTPRLCQCSTRSDQSTLHLLQDTAPPACQPPARHALRRRYEFRTILGRAPTAWCFWLTTPPEADVAVKSLRTR